MKQTAALLALTIAVLAVRAYSQGAADADLERAGAGRTIAIGALSGDRSIARMPLETYVARVLAGEAEQNAPDAELEALAIAIRTYATFNAGRHGRDGFDLCDTTHCQVMRTATAATRRATLATAGRILTWRGAPAEIFYSASCGGGSESAADVWPGSNLPYLKSVKDDVHDDDVPWTYALPLRDAQRLLAQRGFSGERLKDIRVASRTSSGRVGTLHLSGLEPDVIAGDQFRLLVGARDVRSTAFDVEKHGDTLEFTGRGYGHGVGMCVIGAGRRARRGENVTQILAQYYPGLDVTPLASVQTRVRTETVLTAAAPPPPATSSAPTPGAVPPRSVSPAAPRSVVMRGAGAATFELEQAATRAYESMAKTLGTNVAALTIDVHDTVEGFRQATGKPWWVSASVSASTIDLAPPSLLSQRDGIDETLRATIAQAIMAPVLSDRPQWARVGAARYFARGLPIAAPAAKTKLKCPADAELTLAISATAQREAESRAEQCFARAYAATGDWRTVR